MKILINLGMLLDKPTGISNYALNILPYLKPLEPTLLVGKAKQGYNCRLIADNLGPNHGSKGHLRRLIWTERELPRIYHQEKASLLFSPIPEAPITRKLPYIVMVHDLIPLRFPRWFSPLTPYFRYYIPRVVKNAEHIICNSLATAEDIQEFWGINPQRITPIHLGYDAQHFQPLENLPPLDIPYFIYLGRHDPHKNLARLVSAFAKIADNCQEELWLVGPFDRRYTPQLQRLAIALDIASRVKFIDYAPYSELPRLFNQATALVFPSLWEGFGLPVVEAMACGTPVITSNLSSLPEITQDAAILVNPYQVEDVSAAMELLATDEKRRSRLAKLSLRQASQFSWAKTGETTARVLLG
ncbi:MAG: glycosyltransferase family 1 protein [Gloeocapsa sp. DLM2.Bin57]|nr:MAG: glycosyltransferase family 1 protein [Gloeocapsa sp. DLM2.Bin57]